MNGFIAIILLLLSFPMQSVSGNVSQDKPLERLAIIGHETTFMITMLREAQKNFKEVIFVPIREHIQKGTEMPIVPNGVLDLRGKDKFDRLLQKKPQAIISFLFDYGQKIAALPAGDRPKMIILGSKTGLNQYESLPLATKKELKDIQIISFWHSRLKRPDAFHGVGRSILKVLSALHLDKKNRILLLGYGQTGKGIAFYLHKNGFHVYVVDTDPVESVIALHDGFPVGTFANVAKNSDVVIDATSGLAETLTPSSANFFTRPKVFVISTSTHDHAITIQDGYKNSHGTLFRVHSSHGMSNMYHHVGGNDDEAMRLTGLSLLYAAEHYPLNPEDLVLVNGYLKQFSPAFEKKIAREFLKHPQLFGGPILPKID